MSINGMLISLRTSKIHINHLPKKCHESLVNFKYIFYNLRILLI